MTSTNTQDSEGDRSGQEQAELTFITELSMDYEAPIIASIFEANEVPHVIQGLSHRAMMGVLGGGFVPLRLLVPHSYETRARELVAEYRAQLSAEQATQDATEAQDDAQDKAEADDYVPRRRLFTDRARHAGISLLLGSILGFGTASLYARLFVVGVPICLLHLALMASSQGVVNATIALDSLAGWLSTDFSSLTWALETFLTPIDLSLSFLWIMLRGQR
jgi:hypothetical protein